jgi:hypothetical protein
MLPRRTYTLVARLCGDLPNLFHESGVFSSKKVVWLILCLLLSLLKVSPLMLGMRAAVASLAEPSTHHTHHTGHMDYAMSLLLLTRLLTMVAQRCSHTCSCLNNSS